jgi:hypothetical protein
MSWDATTIAEHKRKKHRRKPLPDHIPRTRIEHDLPEHEKICACGCRKTRTGSNFAAVPAKGWRLTVVWRRIIIAPKMPFVPS